VTVRFATSSSTGSIKVSDILFNIQEQLRVHGVASGTAWRLPVEFRLLNIYAYSITSDTNIEVIILDPTNPDNGTLTTIEDRGTPARPARVGYSFPNRVSSNAMYGTTESGRVVVTYAASSGNIGFYVRVKWRPY
jgi:hypothetical protein